MVRTSDSRSTNMAEPLISRNGISASDWSREALPRLESRLDHAAPEFAENAAAMRAQVELLRERYALVQQGGGDEQMLHALC